MSVRYVDGVLRKLGTRARREVRSVMRFLCAEREFRIDNCWQLIECV